MFQYDWYKALTLSAHHIAGRTYYKWEKGNRREYAILHPLSESVKENQYLVRSEKLNGQVHKIVLMFLQLITLKMQELVKVLTNSWKIKNGRIIIISIYWRILLVSTGDVGFWAGSILIHTVNLTLCVHVSIYIARVWSLRLDSPNLVHSLINLTSLLKFSKLVNLHTWSASP